MRRSYFVEEIRSSTNYILNIQKKSIKFYKNTLYNKLSARFQEFETVGIVKTAKVGVYGNYSSSFPFESSQRTIIISFPFALYGGLYKTEPNQGNFKSSTCLE